MILAAHEACDEKFLVAGAAGIPLVSPRQQVYDTSRETELSIRYGVTSRAEGSGEESQELKKGEISAALTRRFTHTSDRRFLGGLFRLALTCSFSSAVLRCSRGRLHLEIKLAKS
jgi:hypothetical protein